MKPIALCLLLCFLSCQKSESTVNINEKPVAAKPEKPSPDYLVDSLPIESKTYTVIQGHPGAEKSLPLCILFKSDTIYRHGSLAGIGFDFEDLDGDGILDIRMGQVSNVGGVKELIMFDRRSGSFKEVKKFSEYPGAKRLEGTKYYYSDHRMGCAGGMWGSELFYIDNFEVKAIARIFIVTCVDADYAKGVTIYKIDAKNERIVEQMVKMPEKYSTEADFFTAYWQNNYKKFE